MWGYAGRNIHLGIREHATTAILTGMAHHGGVVPFGATFFTVSDYMRPSIRLAVLSGAHVIYVWTHDSIAVGEDGPTRQPIEELASLRAMPNLLVLRPADANETVEAWRIAMQHTGGPVGLVLTRQKLPVLDRTTLAPATGTALGVTSWSTQVRGCRRSFSSRPARRCRCRSTRTEGWPARASGVESCPCRHGSCSRRNPPSTARRCCRPRCTPGSAWKRARRPAGNATSGRAARSSA
ncbi:MAG: hypothetical protein JW889_14765 [Verrucomicrobia bacterium]|nr:hypothetical protein [Verrucomicrobiota bacterium]